MSDARSAFSEIYRSHSWLGTSRSGPGSEPTSTKKYRTILERTLRSLPIRSVVDVGCGDWAFSKMVDWGDVDYTGVDIVPDLIADLQSKFATERRRFVVANLIQDDLPAADMCVIKDVLQHLSNDSVQRFLHTQLPRFRYALLTNDIRKARLTQLLRPWRIEKANLDTENGGFRSLKLTSSPFNLQAARVGAFRVWYGQMFFDKEILLWQRTGD